MKLKLPKLKKQVKISGETKIVNEKPPIYKSVCQFLNVKDVNAFFTHGDTIYNPAGLDVPNDIIVHERVHMKQQIAVNMTPSIWWGKWLREPEFRVDQEAQGYGAQLKSLKTIHKDRNQQNKILHNLSLILAGPLYGKAISYGNAMLLIKSYSN